MLKTEQPEYAQQALAAFYKRHGRMSVGHRVEFEHGQLWIISKTGAIWSVIDAEGQWSVDGFDFKLVKEMSED